MSLNSLAVLQITILCWKRCERHTSVISRWSSISDVLHVSIGNIFPRKHHLGIERPWAEWKKSLWKAISISPTSLHRILTSCQNWKQPFISQQQGKANVCWWKRVFSFSFSQNSSFTNLSDEQFGQSVRKNHFFSQNLDSSLRLAEYFKNEDALVGW